MKVILIRVDDKIYEELEKRAKAGGLLTVAEYIRSLILKELGSAQREEEERRAYGTLMEKLTNIVERRIQDRINPFTSKIDELARKLSEIVERVEALEDRVNELVERASVQREIKKEKKVVTKKSAIDILKEQKVIYEHEIVGKIRDRDSFFAKLAREGARILELKDERVALDLDFLSKFSEKLKRLQTQNEDEIKKVLDPVEEQLFKKLKESALVVYNSSLKQWQLLI